MWFHRFGAETAIILSYKAEGDRRTQNPETAPKPVTEIGRAQSTCSRRSARVLGDGQASQRCHDLREAGAPSATSHFRAFDVTLVPGSHSVANDRDLTGQLMEGSLRGGTDNDLCRTCNFYVRRCY